MMGFFKKKRKFNKRVLGAMHGVGWQSIHAIEEYLKWIGRDELLDEFRARTDTTSPGAITEIRNAKSFINSYNSKMKALKGEVI